jgi:hypothetical protein
MPPGVRAVPNRGRAQGIAPPVRVFFSAVRAAYRAWAVVGGLVSGGVTLGCISEDPYRHAVSDALACETVSSCLLAAASHERNEDFAKQMGRRLAGFGVEALSQIADAVHASNSASAKSAIVQLGDRAFDWAKSRYGAVFSVSRSNDRWHASPLALLPGVPIAESMVDDVLLVATRWGDVAVGVDGEVTALECAPP